MIVDKVLLDDLHPEDEGRLLLIRRFVVVLRRLGGPNPRERGEEVGIVFRRHVGCGQNGQLGVYYMQSEDRWVSMRFDNAPCSRRRVSTHASSEADERWFATMLALMA